MILATALLFGCGGEDERRMVPVADLIAALDQTKAAPSQRVHVESKTTSGLQAIELEGDGVIDNRTQKGRLSLDMSGSARGRMEQIISGFTIWMKWDALSEQLGTDKQWVRTSASSRASTSTRSSAATAIPPASWTSSARSAAMSRSWATKPSAGCRRPTTARRSDLRRYPDVAKTGDRDRTRKSIDRLIELTGTSEIPTEIWVGHDTRRIHKTRSNAKYEMNGQSMKMDVTMELYDFGAPVGDTDPPPPEDVYDLAGDQP